MRTGIRCLVLLGSSLLADNLAAQTQKPPTGSQVAQGAKTQPKTGSIRGRVVAADTEAALGKVTLRLSSSEPQGRELPATRTNAQGEYEFKNVQPGHYSLWASRNGYVSQSYGQKSSDPQRSQGTVLMVRAGETLSEIDLKLIRGGVIEGRVVDPDGEPLSNVEVSVERYGTWEGKRSLRPMESANTDDRGQFRIFGISPGKYCVSARYQNWARDDEGDSSYPPVYYPGTFSTQEASRIEVIPGSDVHGIDIALTESKGFSISGKVFRTDGKPVVEAIVTSTRIEEAGWGGYISRGGPVDAEGNFKLRGLLPGRYRIVAESRRSEKRQMAGITLDVGSEDVRGVTLALGDGGEISGRVIIERGDPKSLPASMRVMLESEAGTMTSFRRDGGEVLEDRTFSIRNVMEGAYRLRVFFQFGDLYLKSARIQGEDALDQAFEIRNGEKVTDAEIVLSANGGELTGAVKQEENGEVVKGATIVLFSADPNRQGPRSRWTRTTQSDQQGNFQLRGLAPGEYLVCALLNHEAGAESAPDYIQELAKNAKTVSIQPKTKLNESLLIQPTPTVE